jgi:iron complex outermembrane receptor protein
MPKLRLSRVSHAVLAVVALGPVAANAQDAGAPAAEAAAAAPAAAAGDSLDIVVTAQRREERLQDVPISITAFSRADLAKNNVNDVARLEMFTPGFTYSRTGVDTRPAIRGVRTETVTAGSDPTIGFYIDGIYQSRPQQGSIPLVDVERVEIQRGPQGTLYGRNTFGGNIAITTAAPRFDRVEAGGRLEAGNYNLLRGEAYLNLPLGQGAALRVAGQHAAQDGWVRSVNNPAVELFDREETVLQGSLRLAPTGSGFEAVLRGGYWRKRGGGGGSGYTLAGTLVNPATGQRSFFGVPVAVNPTVRDGIADINGFDVGVPFTRDKYRNDWDHAPRERTDERYGSLNLSYELGDFATARSITGYTWFRTSRTADGDYTALQFPAPGLTAGFPASNFSELLTRDKAFSQELQLASRSSKPFEWIVGLYYLNDAIYESFEQTYSSATSAAANIDFIQRLNVDAYAAYAQASYYVVPDRLRLTAGVRYTKERKDYLILNGSTAQAGGVITGARVAGPSAAGNPEFQKTTFRGGADFFATPDNMLYANVSTGFRSGGINNSSFNPAIPGSFRPENVTAYEIGAKNKLAGGKLIVNLAAFYSDFSDLQVQIFDAARNASYSSNAGKARAKGAEATISVLPLAGLRIDATAAYLDARFTRYVRPNDFFTATNGDPRQVDLAGFRIPFSPTVKTTLGVSYDVDLGAAGTLTPYVAWLHSSSYFTQDFNRVLDRQGSYDKVDLTLTYAPPGDRYTVRVWVNNVGDVATKDRGFYGNSQRVQVGYAPPRLYGLTIAARY